MKIIDLRSDTVTLPTPSMREAISNAELGDDVFGEDPTVNRLEEIAAERLGKEAALLVVSGTMANLVCVLTHCRRGEEVILGDRSHTFLYEAGGVSAVGVVHPHTISNQSDGTMRIEDIKAAVRADNMHFPRTRLLCLENTHNRCAGSPLTVEYTDAVAALGKEHGFSLHLDGARIFNAAVALEVDVKDLTRTADSVSFCLSKGLAAPVGSVVCGSAEFIAEARRMRKLLGGGMRQAGIIAAAGIVAIEQMIDRLADDHNNAKRLAEGIAEVRGLCIDVAAVRTDIVYFDVGTDRITAADLAARLDKRGVKILCLAPTRLRAVTHYGITAEDIESALKAIREVTDDA